MFYFSMLTVCGSGWHGECFMAGIGARQTGGDAQAEKRHPGANGPGEGRLGGGGQKFRNLLEETS